MIVFKHRSVIISNSMFVTCVDHVDIIEARVTNIMTCRCNNHGQLVYKRETKSIFETTVHEDICCHVSDISSMSFVVVRVV